MHEFEIIENIDDTKKVVRNKNGNICFYKSLSIYNLSVFEWLKQHPCIYIPKIIEVEEKEDRLLVLEEYIDGKELSECYQTMTDNERYMVLFQLLEGISYLHHASPAIIHRDIKMENIMITSDGNVKIIDYDAAKLAKKNEPRDTVLLGTEGSAAPEQYGFGSSDERTDIYGIGILIRELFPNSIKMLRVAEKCTELKPDERYQTVEELKDSIRFPVKTKINIPGFREGKISHMLIAIPAYVMMIYIACTIEVRKEDQLITDPVIVFLYRCICALLLFSVTDLFTHWTGIFDYFPGITSKKIYIRILSYALALAMILFVIIVMLVILESFMS